MLGDMGADVILIDFISTEEEEPDLCVSFAIADTQGSEAIFLNRTPKFERLLDPQDRGVRLSAAIDDDGEILTEAKIEPLVATLVSRTREYVLDLSRVDQEDISEMIRVLTRMNFDSSFRCDVA